VLVCALGVTPGHAAPPPGGAGARAWSGPAVANETGVDAPAGFEGLVELLAAFGLAIPIGWERERSDRSMGLRTFPLIAVASCAFVVIAQQMSPGHEGEWNRTLEGVATGVGFLGAAAVVKHGIHVLGTATAAGVWLTAALGAAAGFRLWGIAVALSVIGFATLRLVRAVTPDGKSLDRGDLPDVAVRGRGRQMAAGAGPRDLDDDEASGGAG
jgi:putative Mg2+ transporter-C (MgtC) family protein